MLQSVGGGEGRGKGERVKGGPKYHVGKDSGKLRGTKRGEGYRMEDGRNREGVFRKEEKKKNRKKKKERKRRGNM